MFIVQVHLSIVIIADDNGDGEKRWISDKVKVHKGLGSGVFLQKPEVENLVILSILQSFVGKPGCLSTYLVVQDDS